MAIKISPIRSSFSLLIAMSLMNGLLVGNLATPVRAQQAQASRAGVSQTIHGVVVTLAEMRSRDQAPQFSTPREASPRRTFNGLPAPVPSYSVSSGSQQGSGLSQPAGASSDLPQTPVDKIFGPVVTDTISGFVPPDTMGAVGSIDFLFSVNGRFRAFKKDAPHTQVFNMTQTAFWGSTADVAGVSDGHVRYDRATQRWFITEIDVPNSANNILLAVSSGPDLSTATWNQYSFPGTGATPATDQGCFADYDTPGIDQNAIYIGANMFGGNVTACPGLNYKHSNLYVIQKAPTLSGSATTMTTFYHVATGTFGIETIQGVDSYDALSTGYAISVKETESPRAHLNVWQIVNPGTITPTLSGPTTVAISDENGALGGVLTANNVASANSTRPMDDIDDRLFAAVIRDGHLWTAHNVGVDSSGNSNGISLTRDAVRWFDVTVSGLTLNQSGTVFDSAASGFLEYWMGTLMVSGQGHVAMGLNRANSTTVVQAGAVGRLAGDASGTMRAFSLFQNSTSDAYTDASFVGGNANRWGDYTYTSLDPCDDMTMWTAQEYVTGPNVKPFNLPIAWGVAAEKLQAPAPATPASASQSLIPAGQSSVSVVVTGTSVSGSGFYDTPSTITDPCRKRISAAVSGGVTVNSITYTDPTHVTLDLSTASALPGPVNVTITNPDGQNATGNGILTVSGTAITTTTTITSTLNPSNYGQLVTFKATVVSGSGTPAGTLTFKDGAATLGAVALDLSGKASLSTSTLTAGTHSITAQYGGGGGFAGSSGVLSGGQVVKKLDTSIGLTSSGNPSLIGQAVTITATVTTLPAITPDGTVTFTVNSVPTAPVTLTGGGLATLTTSSLPLGVNTISVSYSGGSNFNPGGPVDFDQTVVTELFLPFLSK
jgi:hypothetical protein